MTLLYPKEHISCYNYEKDSAATAQKKSIKSGITWNFSTLNNKLIYLIEGEYTFSYGKYKNKSLKNGEMILIPAGSVVTGTFAKDSEAYIVRLQDITHLCDCFSLDMLLKEEDESEDKLSLHLLTPHQRIVQLFDLWGQCMSDGLRCRSYIGMKIRELFYLFRAYHPKEELLVFFYPLLSNDISFSEFVTRNHFKVKTVNELAELANYSLSGFQKRFKKVFGISAYTWMKEGKLNVIFQEINNSTFTFKEISDRHGFSSPSHFNDFCKSNFGYTPGVLRKKKINLRILKE